MIIGQMWLIEKPDEMSIWEKDQQEIPEYVSEHNIIVSIFSGF